MRHFPQNLALPPSWFALLRIHSGKGRHLDGRNRDSAAGLADGLPVGHAIEVVPLSLPSLALPCPAVSLAAGDSRREGGQLVRLEAPCSKYVLRSADNVAKSNLR